MNDNPSQSPLYDSSGNLRSELFEPPAWQLLESTLRWIRVIDRQVFLPIDLIVVLMQQHEPTTRQTIALLVRGIDNDEGLLEQLSALARRIERRPQGPAALHLQSFSLGFAGVLTDAYEWAMEAGRSQVSFRDLVRVSRWRAEYQESASVRWALRQLVQPGSERIFDGNGMLIAPLFTPALLARLEDSARLSARCGLPFLGTPHLLAALCNEPSTLLWQTAQSAGVDPLRVRDELIRVVGSRHPELPTFLLHRRTLTPRVVRILMAATELSDRESQVTDESHVLQAFVSDGGSSLDILRALGVEPRLRDRLAHLRAGTQGESRSPRTERRGTRAAAEPPTPFSLVREGGRPTTLGTIGRDLTAEARQGLLMPVLGRDDELRRVIHVLLRTEQRNPLLTGEPGVGKTAIASALAQAIHEERVPAPLRNMRVVEINGAALLGGTSYRGELEERIRHLLEEAEENTILFMDEAHAIFAPTGAGGRPAEVPNHFKAALASGKLSVIAATTDAEYQLWIEQDPALKRRFERIPIDELSAVMTSRILQDRAKHWGELYHVIIPPDAIDATIEFSTRFIPEQSQPDKARKLLMDAAIARGDSSSPEQAESDWPVLTREDVALKLAEKTGIPIERILRNRTSWWRGLSARLAARAPRHEAIANALAEHLLSHRVTIASSESPQGVFVFSGAPSPSREALARALAEELYGSPRAFTRLDMSDFQDPHSLSLLVGSPPGYVGYQDEDTLVTPLRRRPAQVIFLSDFHLAHPKVQDRIFRMLDDGSIANTRGMRADCRHATFVLSVEVEGARRGIGFNDERGADDELRRLYPQLAARLERREIPVFSFHPNAAQGEQTRREAEQALIRVQEEMLRTYGMELQFEPALVDELVRIYADAFGARTMESIIDARVIRTSVAAMMRGAREFDGIRMREVDGDSLDGDASSEASERAPREEH